MSIEKQQALSRIRSNIDRYGFHLYVVTGGKAPRYAYTVGLFQKFGVELIFAGGYYFSLDEVRVIFRSAVAELLKENIPRVDGFESADFGYFSLKAVDSSWSELMLLGAFDLYKNNQIVGVQIVPSKKFWTIDIPDMTKGWKESSGVIWKSLGSADPDNGPSPLRAVTNLAALQGGKITEAARWEEDEWELFSGNGPDVLPEDVRVVPLSILISIDPTLMEIAGLDVGQARWRNLSETEWRIWK